MVKTIAVLVVATMLGLAIAARGAGLDNEFNSVQEDLAEAKTHDFALYHNDLFPGMLFHCKGNRMYFFRGLDQVGLSAPTHMAWAEDDVIKVAAAPAATGTRLGKPWILVWFNGGKGWDETKFIPHIANQSQSFDPRVGPIDVPWLIVLQNQATVRLEAAGVSVESDRPLGDIVFMPLFGARKLRPSETADWSPQLPKRIVQRADRWTSISRRFPVYAKEEYQVDERQDKVRIRNTFDYLSIEDAWQTNPTMMAPLPPMVALARQSAWDITVDNPTDLEMVTHWGPYKAIMNKDRYTYTISGILKYMDEVRTVKDPKVQVPGAEDVRALLIKRITLAAEGKADPRGAYSIDLGMGMLGAWMRAMQHLPDDLKQKLLGYIRRADLINGYFLSPETYVEEQVPVGKRVTIPLLVEKPRKGRQPFSDNLVKQTSRMPFVVWQYGYYSKDWATVQAKYDMVKKMYGFNRLSGWSNVGPEYTAEHAKISAKQGPIGLGRLAKQFGDQPTYDYAVYMLAKALLNEWVWDVAAVDYITENAPWFHNTNTPFIIYENHGYCGLLGLPLDHERTYGEIFLVLDRFNREEPKLKEYNDYYVSMRHRYAPKFQAALNSYMTDYGDATDLKRLLEKPLSDLLAPGVLKTQSHVVPLFYHYPIDLLERGSITFERLYPPGTLPVEWRRGLDTLSRGQSWHQLVVAMRKDWNSSPKAALWPYPAWYLMNPPEPNEEAFSTDALPFGTIQPDLKRLPKPGRPELRSNWNSYLTTADLN